MRRSAVTLVVGKRSRNLHTFFTRYSAGVRWPAWIPLLGLTLLAGCGASAQGSAETGARAKAVAVTPRTCPAGAFRRLGSPRRSYAAVVRSRAEVARRPGAPAFARFHRLNVNHVPTVFAIRGVRVDAACKPRVYLV